MSTYQVTYLLDGITKTSTVEASGIPAAVTSLELLLMSEQMGRTIEFLSCVKVA